MRCAFVRRDGGGALVAGHGGDGWLRGAERWYRSTGNGRSWTRQDLTLDADVLPAAGSSEAVLHDIAFADARTGWIVGRRGVVLATGDGVQTWVRQPCGSRQDLLTLRPVSGARASIGGSARSLLATVTGGRRPAAPYPSSATASSRAVAASHC